MLRLHPDRRAKASELIHHNLLDGIVVQGEIDVIRRMEQEEAERRKQHNAAHSEQPVAGEARSRSRDRPSERDTLVVGALDQSERDAMKPVDDSSIIGEDGLESHYEGETRTAPQQHQHQHNHQSQYHPPLLHAPPQASSAQKAPRPPHEKQSSGVRS